MSCSLHTNCEVRKAQKPDVSADKICIWPVSRMRIPTHTSALHILLYSDPFFIMFVLRRHCFWRINFLLERLLDRALSKAAIGSWCLGVSWMEQRLSDRGLRAVLLRLVKRRSVMNTGSTVKSGCEKWIIWTLDTERKTWYFSQKETVVLCCFHVMKTKMAR